jgi:hypothetical protein
LSLPKPNPTDLLAVVSASSSIAAWQEQLEFWLRIAATLVAIAAGVASLLYHRRARRRDTRPPLD